VATVDHIAQSIMSKKLSEGIDRLVLDVKFGAGAFMKTVEDARHLAQVMADLGAAVGCRTTALLTSMEEPLGRYVGHGAEVYESLELLEGRGPQDTRALVLALAAEVVDGVDLQDLLDSGEPRERFARMVRAQGGDLEAFRWPQNVAAVECHSPAEGIVAEVDAMQVGLALADLGGARTGNDEAPDPDVAVEVRCRPGERMQRGQVWAVLWHRDGRGLEKAHARLQGALRLGGDSLPPPKIQQRVEACP